MKIRNLSNNPKQAAAAQKGKLLCIIFYESAGHPRRAHSWRRRKHNDGLRKELNDAFVQLKSEKCFAFN